MIELKLCPFCGGKAHIHNSVGGIWWYACGQCKAEARASSSKPDALKIWNRRALSTIDPEAKPNATSESAQSEVENHIFYCWLKCAFIEDGKIHFDHKELSALILARDAERGDAIRRRCYSNALEFIHNNPNSGQWDRASHSEFEAAILDNESKK